MVSVLHKFLGDSNEKALKKIYPLRDKVNAREAEVKKLTDLQLREKTDEFRGRLGAKETLDDLLPEAFAVVREVAMRRLSQRHYDVQLIGGVVLHQGEIAEMKTGEGKTLVATLPVYLNALSASGVHVVTVNDYLARRDPVWMGPVYHGLGLSVACLQHDAAYVYDPEFTETAAGMKYLRPVSRADAYRADITYGTNNEFGFDYLRDNMALDLAHRVQRELHYAIVDEVDNILIDEARTPLIISGPAEEPVQQYYTFAKLVPRLQMEEDYTIDDRTRSISLTQEGISKMERWTKVANLYDPENFHLVHYIENALTAQVTKQLDKDYVIRDGEIVIVDEFTGRLQFGRRWSDGLHQAVEAKEGQKIQRESITYATITLQNYFRMYDKLAGMTGTAETEADEFLKIYGLNVTVAPTNLPLVRDEKADLVFQTEEAKWRVVTNDIAEMHEQKRPLLVGTTSIEASEMLSERLNRRGVSHQVLNAKNHEHEATIVAQAGRLGAVTVSTNMAGRGTDIILGGSDTDRSDWQAEHDKVIQLGGLHVIGTDHHDARRIDNQLRGRAGRQGDPGSSQFYVSLEDDLMRRFGGERIKTIVGWTGLDKDTPIENRMITKSIGSAQVKVEGYHFDIRKHLLEFDDVLNKQREVIYADRVQIVAGENLKERILQMMRLEFQGMVRRYLGSRHADDWDVPGFLDELGQVCDVPEELETEDKVYQWTQDAISGKLSEHAETAYTSREAQIGADQMRILERLLLLRSIDTHWVNHLTAMENLRTGIGLHAYGQRDPLVMYRTEGHKMFLDLLARLQYEVVHTLFHVTVTQQPADGGRRPSPVAKPKASPMQAVLGQGRGAVTAGSGKVGRNAPCPCGSGKKYKRCHGGNV
ncbi:MAG: preprotein translocase subunit SecA [Dehalococcoidia bacterium]|jgi:preprotein translocase subunit SecA|nr:preprotein translocase subunit SecA [Dehalococcoidia bacterium]